MLETHERIRMEKITVLTTFHKPGLDEYGQRFLDSFAQRVDNRINLLVYAEGCTPTVNAENIKVFDAFEALLLHHFSQIECTQ